MLKPLVENNVASIFAEESMNGKHYRGCRQALTGPIERGDLQTVRKHLENLGSPKWQRAYQAVGLLVAELAQKKHPERNYAEIMEALESLPALWEASEKASEEG